jgi:hypothetical protein
MNRSLAAFVPAAAFVLTFAAARPASAQPFFGRGATIFDPEISTVQSGVVHDVQATVSADRKYVTMTMRSTSAQLLSLQEFAFQRAGGAPGAGGQGGFVGGAGAANGNGAGANRGAATGAAPAGDRTTGARDRALASGPSKASVLDRPGMTLIGRANTRRT